ncbi:MAG: sodium/proline symporter [Planctomycetes bacterium]|nr:sodium/proline symporter [Planctomycetota bacterium]
MTRETAILVALIAYLLGVLALGWVAKTRTRNAAGFYLGGRTLGPWVAALAANASSSSAWSLVGVSGFAYLQGLGAVWLLPGCLGGFLINWLLVAPRLRDRTGSAVTLTEFLAGPAGERGRTAVVVFASLLTLACLLTYVASQMQAAESAFRHAFGTSPETGVAIGAVITVLYTLLGGYLAVSLTDTIQGVLMALVAIAVPVAAVLHFGGPDAFATAIEGVDGAGYASIFGSREGTAAAGFAMALCGIGLGYPGQPHAVNKYMGMAPGASMTVARTVGIGWAVTLYAGMLVTGWAARAAWPVAVGAHEDALFAASQNLFPPLVDGLVIAAVLAAVMSTVDSQLLVCASCVTHDLRLSPRTEKGMLATARITVLTIGSGAVAAALLVEKNVFDNVLFAWAALGSAFGPLLLVRLFVGAVRPPWALLAMITGGGSAIAAFYLPAAWQLLGKGFCDRVLSWLAALAIAWLGARRSRS